MTSGEIGNGKVRDINLNGGRKRRCRQVLAMLLSVSLVISTFSGTAAYAAENTGEVNEATKNAVTAEAEASADTISDGGSSEPSQTEEQPAAEVSVSAETPSEEASSDEAPENTVSEETVSEEAVAAVWGNMLGIEQAGGTDDTWYEDYNCRSVNTVSTDNPEDYQGINVGGGFAKDYYIVLSRYNGTSANVVVPATATIDGKIYKTILNGMVFQGCTSIKSLTLERGIMTGNDCHTMFSSSSKMTTLSLNGLDTSHATTMNGMFSGCWKLETLDLSSFDTSQVSDMDSMFARCKALTSLDLSSFDTSQVSDMSSMFDICQALTSLDLSSFNTSNVTNMSYMFSGCKALTSLDLRSFDTSEVTDMSHMFDTFDRINGSGTMTSLSINAVSFNTSKVTDMSGMFAGSKGLTSLDLSKFNTSGVTDMSKMFYCCSAFKSLNVSSFNTSEVTDMRYMFSGCTGLTSLDLSKFDTSKVTNMSYMFAECSGLSRLDLSSFTMSGDLTDTANMISSFASFRSLITPGTYTSTTTTELPYGGLYLATDMTKKYTMLSQNTPTKTELVHPYTVTFNTQGGTTVASRMVSPNNTVSAPNEDEEPTKDGYYFYGWYSDSNCTESFNFATQIIKDTTLYAAYHKNITGLSRNSVLDLTSNPVSYIAGNNKRKTANPSKNSITDSAEGWRWDYNARGSTLTLDGLKLTASGNGSNGVLIVPLGTTLVLNNQNEIHADGTDANGLYAAGKLTVSGGGRLDSCASKAAVSTNGLLTVNSGTISADGTMTGIYAHGGMTVNGGNIHAVSNTTEQGEEYNAGIYCFNDMTVNSGIVYCSGKSKKYGGINSRVYTQIHGGNVTAEYKGTTVSASAINPFNMSGGTLSVNSTARGINNGYVTTSITGGTVVINAEKEGINGGSLTVTKGSVSIKGSPAVDRANTITLGTSNDPATLKNAKHNNEVITRATGNIDPGNLSQIDSSQPLEIFFEPPAALSDITLSGTSGNAVTAVPATAGVTIRDYTFSGNVGDSLSTNFTWLHAKVQSVSNDKKSLTVSFSGTVSPENAASGTVKVNIPTSANGTLTTFENTSAKFVLQYSHIKRTTQLDLTDDVIYTDIYGNQKTVNAQESDITDSAEGWSWKHLDNTLTLYGVSINVSDSYYALYAPDRTKIVVSNNTVNSITNSSRIAVYSAGDLSFSGTGSLSINSSTNGIYLYGELAISECRMDVTVIENNNINIAIVAAKGITITSGELTAKIGTDAKYAIECDEEITIGSLEAPAVIEHADGLNSACGVISTNYIKKADNDNAVKISFPLAASLSDFVIAGKAGEASTVSQAVIRLSKGTFQNLSENTALSTNISSITATVTGATTTTANVSIQGTIPAGESFGKHLLSVTIPKTYVKDNNTNNTAAYDLVTAANMAAFYRVAIDKTLSRNRPLDFREYGVSLWYMTVDGENKHVENPSVTSITDSAEGWSWDCDTRTLTLTALDMELTTRRTGRTAIFLPNNAGVILDGADNRIVSQYSDDMACTGIECFENLQFSGSGALNMDLHNTDEDGHEIGIYAESGTISINECTLNIKIRSGAGIFGSYDEESGCHADIKISSGSVSIDSALYGIFTQSGNVGIYGGSVKTSGIVPVSANNGTLTIGTAAAPATINNGKDGEGNAVTTARGTVPGNMLSQSDGEASSYVKITFTRAESLPKEATPDASYDVQTGYLSGLKANAAYTVTCSDNKMKSFTSGTNGRYDLGKETTLSGCFLMKLVKNGIASQTENSDPQTITGKILPHHEAPVSGNYTYSDGILRGLTADMSYKLTTGSGTIPQIKATGTDYALKDDKYTEGQTITALAIAGDGSTYSDSISIPKNWGPVPYRVWLNKNGGSGSAKDQDYTGTDGRLEKLPGRNTVSRNGRIFGGWSTVSDGDADAVVTESKVYSVPDTVLYVYWIKPEIKSGMEKSVTTEETVSTNVVMVKGQNATFYPGTGVWSVLNNKADKGDNKSYKVAAVNRSSGRVSARMSGTADIYSAGRTVTKTVKGQKVSTVYPSINYKVTVVEPKLSKGSVRIAVGDTYTLTLDQKVYDRTTHKLTGVTKLDKRLNVSWVSTNVRVASVADGRIAAIGNGDADVYAYVNGVRYTCHVYVRQNPSSPDKDAKEVTINVRQKVTLSFSDRSASFNRSKAEWTSSDVKTVTVKKGAVTGVSAGSATVTGTYTNPKTGNTVTKTVKVTVRAVAAATDIYMNVGQGCLVRIPGVPNSTKASWKSSDTAVAGISDRGRVSAIKAGTSDITCVYNGVTYKLKVHAEDLRLVSDNCLQPVYDRKGRVRYYELRLNVGQAYTISADGVDQIPRWRAYYSDDDIWRTERVFVDEFGTVQALKAGRRNIYTFINGKKIWVRCIISNSVSDPKESEHDFSYRTMVLIEATEKHAGYTAHICSCGAYYIEKIPKLTE